MGDNLNKHFSKEDKKMANRHNVLFGAQTVQIGGGLGEVPKVKSGMG